MKNSRYLASDRQRTLKVITVGALLAVVTLVVSLGLFSASDTIASAGSSARINRFRFRYFG